MYVGKHQTKNLDDSYMGSGKHLKGAMAKYGAENFTKEILHVFDNEAEMNAKEAELVTEEFCLQEDNYNICSGGKGGFSYINNNGLNGDLNSRDPIRMKADRSKGGINSSKSDTYQKAMKKIHSEGIIRYDTFRNKTHTQDWCQRHSKRMKGAYTGEKNSQFGTIWITDGINDKKIQKDTAIPYGWRRGRK